MARTPRRLVGRLARALRRLVLRAVLAVLALAALLVGLYAFVLPPTTPLMLMERARLGGIERETRPLPAIAPNLARAVVAAEDARFCDHPGIDMEAIRRAVEDWREEGRRRGASTITQQVAKNVFLWPRSDWARKALEVPFAFAIEAAWGKRRILEVYLNVAEWGEGVFGAEAAARRWFGKPAADLTLAEAGRLAAILPAPRSRSAARPSAFVAGRARAAAAGAETLRAEGRDRCFL